MRITDWSSDVCSSDLIAVLALRDHPHPRAGPAISRRRLGANRQRLDEAVEAVLVLEIPAQPAAVEFLGAEMVAALRFLDAVVHTCRSASSFFISAIARAGLRPLGPALAPFLFVWQERKRVG